VILYDLDKLFGLEQWLLTFGVIQAIFFRQRTFNELGQSQHQGYHAEVVDVSRIRTTKISFRVWGEIRHCHQVICS
jgi:hypothetical protein